jgi:hypothetical protein
VGGGLTLPAKMRRPYSSRHGIRVSLIGGAFDRSGDDLALARGEDRLGVDEAHISKEVRAGSPLTQD